jgi:hypothetical protein
MPRLPTQPGSSTVKVVSSDYKYLELQLQPNLDAAEVADLKSQFLQIRSKIRSILDLKKPASRHSSKNYRAGTSDLNPQSSNPEAELSKLKRKSFDLLFKICQGTGFKELDLHHLTLEEAKIVVDQVLDHLEDQMEKHSCKE